MSVSEDLINFDIIETQKENIQALPQGRSAKALATAFAPSPFSPIHTPGATRNLNDTFRAEYEAELQTINDSDDPLDIYDRYVKWTFNAYPSAQATPDSQLRPLLERATKAFQNTASYKNDPRYLKLWIHYIRLFSDAPRETFAYLARHEIGDCLALYYEEFASWLEGAGRWQQAEEIYKLGIEREARPSERLLRKFGEFQKRSESRPETANEPSSPALPTIRPALAAKLDPYATAAPASEDPQAQRLPSASSAPRSGRQKIAIFADADGSLAGKPEPSDVSKGWDNIGSIKDRKKENMIEAKPWAGETMKTGKRVGTVPKMAIFRDQSTSDINANVNGSIEQVSASPLVYLQKTENPKTGKLEQIKVNLVGIYPNANDEFCFGEVMAKQRGLISRDWSKEPSIKIANPKSASMQRRESTEQDLSSESTSRDHTMSDVTRDLSRDERSGKPRKKKTMEVKGETQTIKLNLASPSQAKKVRRKSTAEPTMTMHSRAATDEVLDMFNQTLRNVGSITDEPETLNDSDYDDDDYTSGGESTCTARMSENASEYGEETEALDLTSNIRDAEVEPTETSDGSQWTDFTGAKGLPKAADIDTTVSSQSEEEIKTPDSPSHSSANAHFLSSPPQGVQVPTRPYRDPEQINQNRLPFMTPIVEMTETSMGMPSTRRPEDYFSSKTPSRRRHDGDPAIPELEDLILDGDNTFGNLSKVEEEETETSRLIDIEGIEMNNNDNNTSRKLGDSLAKPSALTQQDTNGEDGCQTEKSAIEELSSLGQLSILDLPDNQPNHIQQVSATFEAIGATERDVVIFDDHVNPIDEALRSTIIKSLQPALALYPGYTEHKPVGSTIKADLERLAKIAAKKSKGIQDKTLSSDVDPVLQLSSDQSVTIRQLLGRGGWATVYLAQIGSGEGSTDLQAMKSEFEPSAWEYALMVLAQARLQHWPQTDLARTTISTAQPISFHSYSDAGYMFESFHEQGNLLELVNRIKADALPAGSTSGASSPGLDEHLAMFFAVEILRTVGDLHSVGILHCDIKADNFLVRLSAVDELSQEWSPVYDASGNHGWSSKGIVLIDFGRAIDTLVFKPDTCFYAEWATDKHDCPEQREARPWTYQADLWGIASIISVLLFGKVLEECLVTDQNSTASLPNLPISSSSTNNKRYKPRDTFKRYWQTDLWAEVFDVLMNPAQHSTQSERVGRGTGIKGLPATKLKAVREKMESFLVANSEKKGLKQSLKRLEEKLASSAHVLTKRR